MTRGFAVGWARTTLSSFGTSFDSVESSVPSKIMSLTSVDGKGLSIMTLDKSK